MNSEEHAAKFTQCSKNLRLLADQLAKIDPDFTATDVAKCCIGVGIAMLLPIAGDGGTIDFLHALAAGIERGEQLPTMN